MPENWYALIIAILLKQPPEAAFQIYKDGTKNRGVSALSTDDTLDMIQFREDGMKYKAIGEMYGLSESQTHRRINGFKIKNNRPVSAGTA